jgi:hypothetical protein
MRNRTSKASWTIALLMLGCLVSALAQETDWRVSVDVQMVAISPANALKLVPALHDPETFERAFAKLQRMIERDEADLVGWPVVNTEGKFRNAGRPNAPKKNGGGQPWDLKKDSLWTSKSVVEARYPTEFFPPEMPGPLSVTSLPQLLRRNTGFVTTPTAFEARDLGVTLEVDGKVLVSENGDFVELAVTPQRVLSLGARDLRAIINPSGIQGIFYTPQFLSATVTSVLTVHSGRRILLGTFVETKPEAKVLLFLLKTTATRAGL